MTADTSASASVNMGRKGEKEVIHSGHFMVSDFEADAQDDEENVLLEIPGDIYANLNDLAAQNGLEDDEGVITYAKKSRAATRIETVSIDSSLTKLFNAMSIAYRQKITSPKWNRFKGLKLRWKDKIRLNNVIWRCWHMQFIRKKRMTVCQFALDVDIHNRPESGCKSKEYSKSVNEKQKSLFDLEGMDFSRSYSGMPPSLEEGDLSEFMDFTDLLFSSLVNPPQPFAFPNPREIARGTGNSDFIQPGLIQLQPNLDDFMDIVEPLQEMLAGRGLPTVPEEDFLPEVGETPDLPPAPPSAPSTSPPLSSHHYPGGVAPAQTFLEAASPTHSPSHKPITTSLTHPKHSPVFRGNQIPLHDQPAGGQGQQQQQLVPLPTQSPPVSYQASLVRSPLLTQPQQTLLQQQPPPPAPTQLQQQLQQPHTPPQQVQQPHTPPQQSPASPQQAAPPRSFIRSHSHHDLTTPQHQQPAVPTPHHESSFVIPKSLPRRRSHSSGGSNSSGGLIGSPSLAPHQVISSVPVTLLPDSSLAISSATATTLPQIAPAPSAVTVQGAGSSLMPGPVIASVQAAHSPASSALLAQLLSSGSCPINSSCHSVSGSHLANTSNASHVNNLKNNSMTVNSCNNVKASLVIPGVITGNGTASSSCTSSNSSISSISSNNNMKPVVTAAILVPPITLSAVTPSTLKTQISPWSPCSPQGIIKQSPPHPEPSSPLMMNVPSPPSRSFRAKSDSERVQYKEHRRVCHINAEQKRRSNLKNNFDIMHQLIPSISQNANAKISKAVMLQKGAEYIHQLKSERQQLTEQAEKLRAQIESLSCEISNAQALLPATGAPMTHARYSKLKEMFNSYVHERTLANWKFWLFSLITEPLLESYNNSVSTSCLDDLCRSSLAWLDQQCSLNVLRPLVSSSMRKLSTTTNVLADPDSLPEEIYRRVTKQEGDRFHHR
ncbi:MLX-interacting protein isoform X3 [Panulirus ornatus]|uniref:MLX-interacting protein isoform X3 n=1 Tax=Panulirus ornatus TaxID=150431 RepID=UPI003A8B00AB